MDERAATPSIRDVMLVVIRQRHVIVAVYAGIVATAIAAIFVLPPEYRAAAKVLLTTNRAEISTSSERPTELIRTSQVSDAELNSQLEILRSRDLIESVLADMEGGQPRPADGVQSPGVVARIVDAPMAALRAAYRRLHDLQNVEPTSAFYWRVKDILGAMEVANLRGSNVLEIAIKGPDPAWAADFVNRLTAVYVERQAKMQRETEAEGFFNQQSEILRQKLAESEAALRNQREAAGALAGQQAEVHERLNEFSADLARTKIALREQEERVAFLERTQAADRRTGRVATPELVQLEAKRAQMVGRYRSDSERMREIDDQIKTLRAAIASYDGVDAGKEGAATDLTAARASIVALRGKEEALSVQRDEYRRQAEMLDSQNFDLVRLERQVKLDEEAYLSYVRTAEQSRLSNAIEQSKMLRLAVLEPATVPMEPFSPRKGRILFFALFGGLAASVGIGVARDQLDRRLRTASDIRRHAKLDVLAVLPERG